VENGEYYRKSAIAYAAEAKRSSDVGPLDPSNKLAPSPSSDQSFGAPHRGSESAADGSHDLG
jgi:hypothetical protein